MLRKISELTMLSMTPDGSETGGSAAVDSGFADFDDDDSIEIVGPGQQAEEDDEEPEKVTLSKEEFEALRNSANSVEAMREGISKLGDTMQGAPRSQQPVNDAPVQQQGENDDAFWKRFQDELFKSDNPKPLFEEMMNRMASPYVNQQNVQLAKANKSLMLLDPERGPRFKKYLSEIEAFVQTLPKEQHMHPQVWEYSYNQVLQRHTDDLIAEEVERRMNEQNEKRVESLDGGQQRPAQQSYSGAGSGSVSPTKKKRRVQLTAKDYEIMSKEGMSERDYAAWKMRNM